MPRPPLYLGTHGKIQIVPHGKEGFIARCRFRDWDGRTRPVKRKGSTKTAANRNLQVALKELRGVKDQPLRTDDRFKRVAEVWRKRLDTKIARGKIVETTADRYRQRLDSLVLPALGELRLRECTVARIDTFLAALDERGLSAETLRGVRTVISGVLGLAVYHEVLAANPVRDLEKITGKPGRPRALTTEQRREWLRFLATDPAAVRRDLHDLTVFMLGTGVRIGEALALRWSDVDLDGVPVDQGGELVLVPIAAITGNIVHVKGKGLIRHPGKTATSLRIVPLPRFVTEMLSRRHRHGEDAPVFPSRAQGTGEPTWRSPGNVTTYIREARKAAGIEWKLTSHTYRKTAATIWNDAGVLSDRQVGDLTGHKKLSTMKDLYVGRDELHPQGAVVMDAAWMDS
jgi:integrase